MSSHTTTVLTLSPDQCLWLCLAPRSTLHTTEGRVAVHWAPAVCGEALRTPSRTVLEAGAHLPSSGQAPGTWAQLHNPSGSLAIIHLVESVPEPGLAQRTWGWLRDTFPGGTKRVRDLGHRGGLNAAR